MIGKYLKILQKYPGNIPVVLRYEDEKRTMSAPHFRVEKIRAAARGIEELYYENDFSLKNMENKRIFHDDCGIIYKNV